MDIKITDRCVTMYDYCAIISYSFEYNNKRGEFVSSIDEVSNNLDFSLEFDGVDCDWAVDTIFKGSNCFDSKFKEAFEKCFFVKIPE